VSISESRKSKPGTLPIVSTNRRPQRRPLRVSATELARRRFLHLTAGAAALPAVSCDPGAQSYPSRPVTLIVPAPAGGVTDVIGRVVAERMRTSLGQAVIVENISGGDGSIGVGRAARARPDGYTIHMGYTSTVFNGAFYSLPYDVLNDFAPVLPLATSPVVLFARKTLPVNDLNELIAWLKANSNRASAAVPTVLQRLLMVFFQKDTGTQFALVAYRGTAPAMQDLVAGQIDLSLGAPTELPLMRSGSIKAFAVTT
jgi:tripartite-type tricarboxylate transporter receptor subunit TctC